MSDPRPSIVDMTDDLAMQALLPVTLESQSYNVLLGARRIAGHVGSVVFSGVRRCSTVAVLFTFFISVATFADEEAPNFSIDKITRAAAARATRYSEGSYQFEMKVYNSDKPAQILVDRDIKLLKSGQRLAIVVEDLKNKGTPKYQLQTGAWDGVRQTGYQTNPAAPPEKRYSGTIAARRAVMFDEPYRALTHEEFQNDHVPLAEAFKLASWRPIGFRRFGSHIAYGLETDGPIGKRDKSAEVWVVPGCDFAPVYYRETLHYAKSPDISITVDNVELKQFGDRWVADHATVTTSNPSLQRIEQIAEYTLKEYSPAIPGGTTFVVKFPVGTRVYDAIDKVGFVAGKFAWQDTPAGRNVHLDINKFPQYVALTDYHSGLTPAEWNSTSSARSAPIAHIDLPRKAVPRHRGLPWLVGGAVLLIALIAGIPYFRSRRT